MDSRYSRLLFKNKTDMMKDFIEMKNGLPAYIGDIS